MSDYVPLSVRYGNRRKKFGWWVGCRREALALRLAPWLNSGAFYASRTAHLEWAAREVIAAADNTYTEIWRTWQTRPLPPQDGAARLSKALADLEAAATASSTTDRTAPFLEKERS